MRLGQLTLLSSIALTLAVPAVASTRKHANTAHKTTVSKKTAAKPKFQSQRGIDDQRATAIQAALIKAGYLSGEPSGHWDAASIAAMTKVQADNGWQTKLVPDSRAIIKLGLGPGSASETPAATSTVSASSEKPAPLPFTSESEAATPAQQ